MPIACSDTSTSVRAHPNVTEFKTDNEGIVSRLSVASSSSVKDGASSATSRMAVIAVERSAGVPLPLPLPLPPQTLPRLETTWKPMARSPSLEPTRLPLSRILISELSPSSSGGVPQEMFCEIPGCRVAFAFAFAFARQRHHCRNCGKSVCAAHREKSAMCPAFPGEAAKRCAMNALRFLELQKLKPKS